jgi:hypothetical protein
MPLIDPKILKTAVERNELRHTLRSMRRRGPRTISITRSASIWLLTPTAIEWRAAVMGCLEGVQTRGGLRNGLYSSHYSMSMDIHENDAWGFQWHGHSDMEHAQSSDPKPWPTTVLAVATIRRENVRHCAVIAARVRCVYEPSKIGHRTTTMRCMQQLHDHAGHDGAMAVFDMYRMRHVPAATPKVRGRGLCIDETGPVV